MIMKCCASPPHEPITLGMSGPEVSSASIITLLITLPITLLILLDLTVAMEWAHGVRPGFGAVAVAVAVDVMPGGARGVVWGQ